jgi:hypothetical protein
MDLDDKLLSPEQQGLLVSLVALQQANGIDFDTAVARVRASYADDQLLYGSQKLPQLVDMMRWFATPPSG